MASNQTYAKTQFSIGEAKTRYNQITQLWHPAVGGAVKFSVGYAKQKDALAEAEVDLKANNFSKYE